MLSSKDFSIRKTKMSRHVNKVSDDYLLKEIWEEWLSKIISDDQYFELTKIIRYRGAA